MVESFARIEDSDMDRDSRPPFPKFLVHPDYEVFQSDASGSASLAAKCQSAAHVMIYAMDDKKRDIYKQKAHVMVKY